MFRPELHSGLALQKGPQILLGLSLLKLLHVGCEFEDILLVF